VESPDRAAVECPNRLLDDLSREEHPELEHEDETGRQSGPPKNCARHIVHGQNGFTISKDNAVTEAVDVMMRHYNDHTTLDRVKRSLMPTVKQLFSIERVLPQYNQLNLGKAPLADRS
jgi:hypothetical protein